MMAAEHSGIIKIIYCILYFIKSLFQYFTILYLYYLIGFDNSYIYPMGKEDRSERESIQLVS